jgi:hypothetical protein
MPNFIVFVAVVGGAFVASENNVLNLQIPGCWNSVGYARIIHHPYDLQKVAEIT